MYAIHLVAKFEFKILLNKQGSRQVAFKSNYILLSLLLLLFLLSQFFNVLNTMSWYSNTFPLLLKVVCFNNTYNILDSGYSFTC